MIIPIDCPICSEPLINEDAHLYKYGGRKFFIKKCNKKLNHKLGIVIDEQTNLIESIFLQSFTLCAYWYYSDNKLTLHKLPLNSTSAINIPWFEPDLFKFQKLLNKLKTYIVFS